jgi:hypothetical protein
MLGRMVIAIVGALVITAGLFLAMDAATGLFRERDLQRYFRITDILPKPEPGRPERPGEVVRPPGTRTLELPEDDATQPRDRSAIQSLPPETIARPAVPETAADPVTEAASETGN